MKKRSLRAPYIEQRNKRTNDGTYRDNSEYPKLHLGAWHPSWPTTGHGVAWRHGYDMGVT